ncbi:hypothetical protein E4T52_05497 [Aureobasidium sp. EXF-3400]|nr:hypothetical protein E4T51_07093 [Aureobasidium sp. EXF-12344]KAI4779555.1 hypothetical protein E4T52_05497 [Aureobasidium sp. EXF-3400]
MAAPEVPFSQDDVSTWTYERVRLHVESGNKKHKSFFQNFFGWSATEYKAAKNHTWAELQKHFDATEKFPTTGPQAELRHTVQVGLVRDWPDLFVNRHSPSPPSWFDVGLISRTPSRIESFNMRNVVQQFISLVRNSCRATHQSLKRSNHAGNNDDDDNNDDNDNDNEILHKRPRLSRLDGHAPFPITTSMSMPPSPSVTVPGSQTSGDMMPQITGLTSIRNKKTPVHFTAAKDQNLVLERDRFSLVDRLFEKGQLIESRIQELVFGNPLDDKPTFLWYFDETSDDKPRSIRNRPSAETAVLMLQARAERAEAIGIQLFDAADRDTAALVPVHEVKREDDFVERVSFELEIDHENDDNDNDDSEKAQMASRTDHPYGSRDGELQLDDVAVKEEVDKNSNITWEGPQQQQVDGESSSESEEDEDIRRFYK